MRTSSLLPIIAVLFLACTSNSETANKSLSQIESEILSLLSEVEGDFAVTLRDINNPVNSILINQDERFHAASTMKTPVLIELYKQQETGTFSVGDSMIVKNEFSSIVDGSPYSMSLDEDSEPGLYEQIGQPSSIRDLAYAMITRSSNLATNILINMLDAKKVTSTMRSLGADSIEVLRGVEDIKAFELGLSNSTTARDLLIIFEQLASGTLISEDANKEMIEILKDQKFNDMIPALLPDGTEVAHKTGWITGVHHDSGIVYLPDGNTYIIVFLSKNAPDRELVLETGAKISKLFADYLAQSNIQAEIDWNQVYTQQGLELVDIVNYAIDVELRYSTTNNFVGKDVYGSLEEAFLQPETAQKLYKAAELLDESNPGYKLRIYDGARPRRIQQVLWNAVDHIPLEERPQYVANPQTGSIHNYGCAIDLTVVDETGTPLDMGTDYDNFTRLAHVDIEGELLSEGLLSETQIANRKILRDVMTEAGFGTISSEWWHFDAFPRAETKSRFKMVE